METVVFQIRKNHGVTEQQMTAAMVANQADPAVQSALSTLREVSALCDAPSSGWLPGDVGSGGWGRLVDWRGRLVRWEGRPGNWVGSVIWRDPCCRRHLLALPALKLRAVRVSEGKRSCVCVPAQAMSGKAPPAAPSTPEAVKRTTRRNKAKQRKG